MIERDPSNRLTSSDVVERIARDYDAFLASWEKAPERPYLVAFMPEESRATVYAWGWIDHSTDTAAGVAELAQLLEDDL